MHATITDIADLTAALDISIIDIESAHGESEGFIRGTPGAGGEQAVVAAVKALGAAVSGTSWDGPYLRIFVTIGTLTLDMQKLLQSDSADWFSADKWIELYRAAAASCGLQFRRGRVTSLSAWSIEGGDSNAANSFSAALERLIGEAE